MKTYTTITKDGFKYHYRVHGNSYGWKMFLINDQMLDAKLWCSAGKEVRQKFWSQPIDKTERRKFYVEMALSLTKYL